MLKFLINKLLTKQNLTEEEAYSAMNSILKGECTESQIGALLIALRMKGESVDEITGCARAMRDNAIKLDLGETYAIDTCGTGGDGGRTFNISTASSIIAACGNVKIAKHGNVAVSSKSGSADVLRSLGVNIEMEPEKAKELIEKIGISFIFAQKYHKAMKNAAPVRRELGARTVFNIIGPLTNPAFVKGQVMGIYSEELTNQVAKVLLKLGSKKAMVVHGMDGLDEITVTTKTKVSEIKNGVVVDYFISPEDFGMKLASLKEIEGGTSEENAEVILNVLKGEKGARRDIVLLNAAAALYVGEGAKDLKEGLKISKDIVDSGKALRRLEELKYLSYKI